jgi:hypothetical protein
MYKNGLGLQVDKEMSKKLLEEAAINKNPNAMYMLKEIEGDYGERDRFEGINHELFVIPGRINLQKIVPYIDDIKL